MIISVYGAGYVGLVSAVCLAKLGYQVICADIDEHKIHMLLEGKCPIYEDGLPELLEEQLNKRLMFTNNLVEAIKKAEIHIIATGTPSLPDGSADLSQVFAVATMIAQEADIDGILVIKSTVPVRTGDAVQTHVEEELLRGGKTIKLAVCANPEFLREGTAVYDFLHADRIVIGGEDKKALDVLKRIYQPLVDKGIPLLCMNRRSAELTKYASNAMLALRISFINYISQLAEALDANVDEIRQGIGFDHRIGPHFLFPGIGYGGSCFPKDVRALIQIAKSIDMNVDFLEAIENVNQWQKDWVFKQVSKHFHHNLKGLTIGLWGLSFKPGTDDLREASSLVIIDSLLCAGVQLRVYDPVAMPAAKKILEGTIIWCESAEEVLDGGVDALVIATEWLEFKNFCLRTLKDKLGKAPLIDGRNCFDLSKVAFAGLSYYSVGRPLVMDGQQMRSR
ncbi:UDP-glucose 6-dehydrogenase [Legionella lansingensis]|uniref:UDP-glucose 6-dehydrogenase n=1 Tax=Legionella lansingensis TaxID=45067 RepID=A0A0W0VWW5_9GAMM|nr:UDP-glucose/GDP-mannose dehydrogenase family protein [Legionella lansingensis]KTD24788.1 UDP-glucose 6-dehydrogenase [Legionella lansingensis]SNV48961.1 UDP-glucose 6-dehydrogenase [Legionella lansingensis]